MSDYFRRSAFADAVDRMLEMDPVLRGITPAWQESLRLGSALETFRSQWDEIEAAKHSIGEAFRASLSLNDHVRAMIDAQPRISGLVEDYSRRMADLAALSQPAVYRHINDLQIALVESARFPGVELAVESARAAQEAWSRSVLIPRRDLKALSASTFDLLREAIDSFEVARAEISEEPEETKGDTAEIEKARDRIAATFKNPDPEVVLRDLGQFLAEAKTQKDVIWRAIVLGMFINLLSSMVEKVALTVWESLKDSRPAITSIRSTARALQRSGHISSDLRVVLAQSLVVRAGPSKNTRPVGRLYLGDVVAVLKVRNRSWALVEFRNQEEEIVVRGWVFRRYLQTLRGSGCAALD